MCPGTFSSPSLFMVRVLVYPSPCVGTGRCRVWLVNDHGPSGHINMRSRNYDHLLIISRSDYFRSGCIFFSTSDYDRLSSPTVRPSTTVHLHHHNSTTRGGRHHEVQYRRCTRLTLPGSVPSGGRHVTHSGPLRVPHPKGWASPFSLLELIKIYDNCFYDIIYTLE